jgi:hypothetical protein
MTAIDRASTLGFVSDPIAWTSPALCGQVLNDRSTLGFVASTRHGGHPSVSTLGSSAAVREPHRQGIIDSL